MTLYYSQQIESLSLLCYLPKTTFISFYLYNLVIIILYRTHICSIQDINVPANRITELAMLSATRTML